VKSIASFLALLLIVATVMLASWTPTAQAATGAVLKFPAGITYYVYRDGNVVTPDAYGTVTLTNLKWIDDYMRAGFIVAPVQPAVSGTCTKNAVSYVADHLIGHGTLYGCYSTNLLKPLIVH